MEAVRQLRHADCLEANDEARARGKLRKKARATLKPHKVWFDSAPAREGFEAAVGIEAEQYLTLARVDEDEREFAAECDEQKITYYAKCILSVSVCMQCSHSVIRTLEGARADG